VAGDSHSGQWVTIPVKGKQKEVRQVALASRLLQNVGGRDLDKVVKLPGTSEFQLVQEINVCFPGGENRRVRVLIDTGASVNLVRKGLFPESDFIPAKNPVQLSTANGQLLDGGQCTIKLRMTFGQDNGRIVQPWRVWGEFYEADTRADMILSYPWLGANHLAVIPEYGCLALRTSGFRFLPIHSCPEFDKGPEEEESQEIETGRGARVGCTPPFKKKSAGIPKGWTGAGERQPLKKYVHVRFSRRLMTCTTCWRRTSPIPSPAYLSVLPASIWKNLWEFLSAELLHRIWKFLM
jgi:hypothetical protein